MKILHATEVSHGGVVSLMETLAGLQSERGHDVHVLAPSAAPEAPVPQHVWEPRRRSPRRLARARRDLHSVVRRERPDLVHLHSFFAGVLGRLRRLDPAVVYQPHSWAFAAAPTFLGPPVVARWERWAGRHTDGLVTNCTEEMEEGDQFGLCTPVSVIGLPLDTEHYRPADPGAREAARSRFGLTSKHVLVCVGRLSRQKGQVSLAEQWERTPLPDTTLVLVGPGDPHEVSAAAPHTFGDSLRHVGAQEDVRAWLWAADVCVQPSLYEGQSVAMAEALACGTPVVMTDVNGAREVIDGTGPPAAGHVVPVGDMPAVLRACDDLLHRPTFLEAAGEVGREVAVRHFESGAVIERLDTVYEHAVAAAASR
jgi:glycosyltransferase involved in cell wall biosynthesis